MKFTFFFGITHANSAGIKLQKPPVSLAFTIHILYSDFYMYEVRVEADFAAAHFLRDYHGKCENLHGHNYKVYAHVRGSNLDEGGMLLDFTQIKKTLRNVCELLDHKNLNDFDYFDQNPSAERIATFIAGKILDSIPELKDKNGTHLHAIDVFETDTSRARYILD